MKILNVNTSLGIGGTERAAVNYAVGYKKLGHDSRFLVVYGGENRVHDLEYNDVPLYSYASGKETLLDQLQKWAPQVIHFHRSNAIDPNIKEVIEHFKHDNQALIVETNVFSRYLDSVWYRQHVDISLQLSNWCLWKYNRWKGNHKKPVSAYGPYPVEGDRFFKEDRRSVEGFKKKHKIDINSLVLGRLGQPLDSKWHTGIISFFAQSCQKYDNLILFLVGPPLSVTRKIEKLPIRIREKVRIIDRIEGDEDLRLYYSSLDLFIHWSSIGESFGYVLVEAMLCEVPVITMSTPFRDNSQVEVVGNNQGGSVVGDEQGLQVAFQDLYENKEGRCQLKRGLRKWVLNRFEITKVCGNLLQAYERHLQKGGEFQRQHSLNPGMILFDNQQEIGFVRKSILYLMHQRNIYLLYRYLSTGLRGR